jgi:hypothetical protein
MLDSSLRGGHPDHLSLIFDPGVRCGESDPYRLLFKGGPVISEPVLRFVRSTIKSGWALELLLIMYRRPDAVWTVNSLTAELRGSAALVADLLASFEDAGLIERDRGGSVHYRPHSLELHDVIGQLERIYAERPLSLIKEILSQPNDKIQSFADAFRWKQE